mgnify:CR=1 FL=1
MYITIEAAMDLNKGQTEFTARELYEVLQHRREHPLVAKVWAMTNADTQTFYLNYMHDMLRQECIQRKVPKIQRRTRFGIYHYSLIK